MYEPGTKKSEFKPAPSGVAVVKRLKGGSLGIQFLEENENEFAGMRFKVTDWPSHVKPKKVHGRTWYIGLTNDKDGIWKITPQNGVFTGKVQKFASAEGQPPVPQEDSYEWKGKTQKYQYFTVLIEIIDGDPACIGMVITYRLRYYFTKNDGEEDENEKGMVMYDKERSKYTPILKDFLRVTGAWKAGSMKFSENILPKLQKRILKEGVEFKFVMKDGWIDSIFLDSSYSEDVDEEEDVFWNEEEFEKENKKKKKKKKKSKESDDFDWEEED